MGLKTKVPVSNNEELLYKKLRSLFRALYELEQEEAMFKDDELEIIDSNTKDYLDQLIVRKQGYEQDIKNLLNKAL